jgi:pimeloyl-ACP methyl ester carboxylesterase
MTSETSSDVQFNIVFAHANSFPASTYKLLFANLRSRGFSVEALEKFAHTAQYPVTNNWPHLVQELVDFAQPVAEKTKQPVWLVGHSLGGILSAMVAAQHPGLVRGVVLMDAPILSGWRSSLLGFAKKTQWFESYSPAATSRKRRNSWPSTASALEHFQSKPAFASWEPTVLQDYVQHGMLDENGQRILAFDRDIETQIYNTLPNNLDALFQRHPVQCPVTYIGGRHSLEMRQVGMAMTRKLSQGRVLMLDGSHLFPMENPLATAAAIETALRNMQAQG